MTYKETLKELKELLRFVRCSDCGSENSSCNEACKTVLMLKTVIAALEKQTPRKPNHYEQEVPYDEYSCTIWEYDCCPVCGEEVKEEYDYFCGNCGQAIDWCEEVADDE